MVESASQFAEIIGKSNIRKYKDYYDFLNNNGHIEGFNISQQDWLPESQIYHQEDFINWIDSFFERGFHRRIDYDKFDLYRIQAYQWLCEDRPPPIDRWKREEFAFEEMDRIQANTLYFLNKYMKLKEGNLLTGKFTYVSWEAQEIMTFLIDSGYNLMLGKSRQIASSSTLGGIAVKRVLLGKNYFIKFISATLEKTKEIFEDKIKYPYMELEPFLQARILNDSSLSFSVGTKERKGIVRGTNSKISVCTPDIYAINGGSPNLVMIDEMGLIPFLSNMLNEGRPTMLVYNPETGKLRMTRQVVMWGTGTGDNISFETQWNATKEKWFQRDAEYGIVPVFFNWRARPGFTQKDYDREKSFYYSKEGVEGEKSRLQFRQHYPETDDDMFASSDLTLVSLEKINIMIKKCLDYPGQYGYFEPTFDQDKPTMAENSDLPFAVIGSKFVPCEQDDPRVTGCVLVHPDKRWRNRYYQGTDPVMQQGGGSSKMASVIYDAYYNSLTAMVNVRNNDHRYNYLQTLLLGLYYSADKNGIKELPEANIGQPYMDYKEDKGFAHTIVYNAELPLTMQMQSRQGQGYDNRGQHRVRMLVDKLYEMTATYGDRIFLREFWIQLKTFTKKTTKGGNEKWESSKKDLYPDDIIDAAALAYICRLTYGFLIPVKIDTEENTNKIVTYNTIYDSNYNLVKVPVMSKVLKTTNRNEPKERTANRESIQGRIFSGKRPGIS